MLFSWHAAKVQKIEDVFTHELIVAASGAASRLNWAALNALAGTKFRMVTGYEGPASAKIAMMRGEVEALSLPWSALGPRTRNGCATGRSTFCSRPALKRTPTSRNSPA